MLDPGRPRYQVGPKRHADSMEDESRPQGRHGCPALHAGENRSRNVANSDKAGDQQQVADNAQYHGTSPSREDHRPIPFIASQRAKTAVTPWKPYIFRALELSAPDLPRKTSAMATMIQPTEQNQTTAAPIHQSILARLLE